MVKFYKKKKETSCRLAF